MLENGFADVMVHCDDAQQVCTNLRHVALPAAAVLEAPLSLWWAIQQSSKVFPARHTTASKELVVHYLGTAL